MTKTHWVLALLALALAGCQAQPVAGESKNSSSSLVPAPSPIPDTIPTYTQAATQKDPPAPELSPDCRQGTGSMQHFDLESAYLDAGLQFRVWLPPCYTEQPERRFPVLYLIHGQTFADDQWDRIGADEAAAQGIAKGDYEPFLIVMPFDLSSGQPSTDPFREAFIQELAPYVDAEFRTLAAREYRAVGGLSRGASWALHFALHYPELFGAVGGHSPPVFVEDAPQMRTILEAIPGELMPHVWLDIGEKDQQTILNSAVWFEELLTELNIAHEWRLFQGFHDEDYWSSHVGLYLGWYAQGW